MARADTARRTAATLAVIGLGVACGQAVRPRVTSLPTAGSARDDGSGLLAAWSSRPVARPDDGEDGGVSYAYRQGTGGTAYGGAAVGGARYAGYQFAPNITPRVPPAPYDAGYTAGPVERGGQIEGAVRWPEPPSPAVSPTESSCAGDTTATLELASGQVVGAVVYLDGITRGRVGLDRVVGGGASRLQVGGSLELGACDLAPRVQLVAPIGAGLTIRNRDGRARSLAVARVVGDSRLPMFEVAVHPGGTSDAALEQAGLVQVSPIDQPGLDAWLVVQGHPYFAVTDQRGEFRLDDVPAGSYELVVWHPPVLLGRAADGAPRWSAAAVRRQRVVVRAEQTTRATLSLSAAR